MLLAALSFGLLIFLPADFDYPPFAALLFVNGLSMGMFIAPNTAGVMNSVPRDGRGVASGMLATFQNSGMTLSIGIFFSLMIAGLSGTLPSALFSGLTAHGVAAPIAHQVANLPPVGSLFAAFLGYNPIAALLGPGLHQLPPATAAFLTGKTFFPNVIGGPFVVGMHMTFFFSMMAMLVAAAASYLRGGIPTHIHPRPHPSPAPAPLVEPSAVTVRMSRPLPSKGWSPSLRSYGASGSEIDLRSRHGAACR
jgi:MFS family permease